MHNIRAATPTDAEEIGKMHVEVWRSLSGIVSQEYLDSLTAEGFIEKWKKNLSDPSRKATTLVAESDGRIDGFVSVGPCREDEKLGEVWSIYVRLGKQRGGIGSTLMEEGLSLLRTQGFKKAVLWVIKGNTPAITFYETLGWKNDKIQKENNNWKGVTFIENRFSKDL